jgi:hypothetical protein
MYTLPRVALRPPVGVLRCTRGYTPSPLRGVKQGEGCQMNGMELALLGLERPCGALECSHG